MHISELFSKWGANDRLEVEAVVAEDGNVPRSISTIKRAAILAISGIIMTNSMATFAGSAYANSPEQKTEISQQSDNSYQYYESYMKRDGSLNLIGIDSFKEGSIHQKTLTEYTSPIIAKRMYDANFNKSDPIEYNVLITTKNGGSGAWVEKSDQANKIDSCNIIMASDSMNDQFFNAENNSEFIFNHEQAHCHFKLVVDENAPAAKLKASLIESGNLNDATSLEESYADSVALLTISSSHPDKADFYMHAIKQTRLDDMGVIHTRTDVSPDKPTHLYTKNFPDSALVSINYDRGIDHNTADAIDAIKDLWEKDGSHLVELQKCDPYAAAIKIDEMSQKIAYEHGLKLKESSKNKPEVPSASNFPSEAFVKIQQQISGPNFKSVNLKNKLDSWRDSQQNNDVQYNVKI